MNVLAAHRVPAILPMPRAAGIVNISIRWRSASSRSRDRPAVAGAFRPRGSALSVRAGRSKDRRSTASAGGGEAVEMAAPFRRHRRHHLVPGRIASLVAKAVRISGLSDLRVVQATRGHHRQRFPIRRRALTPAQLAESAGGAVHFDLRPGDRCPLPRRRRILLDRTSGRGTDLGDFDAVNRSIFGISSVAAGLQRSIPERRGLRKLDPAA